MLLEEGHPQTLLDDGLDGVPLQVEHVLRVLGHHSHTGVEVRTLWVGYILKTLPPHWLLLLEECHNIVVHWSVGHHQSFRQYTIDPLLGP
jgi:hypothetical protein